MGYSIVTDPVIPAQNTNPEPNQPTSSSNAAYGMKDVPETEKKKVFTPEQAKEALKNGELMYGPVPELPTIQVFDDVSFDFCDGLRVRVAPQPEGQPKKKYYVHMMENKMGVILHSGILESDSFVCTVQKFYCEFAIQIIKQEDLPEDYKKIIMDTYKLDSDDVDFIVGLARLPDCTTDIIKEEFKNKRDYSKDQKLVQAAAEDLLKYAEEHWKYQHTFDPKDKEVMVQLPVGTIGDSVGWFSYMERFQQKLGCKLICVMNPAISCLYEKQYPDITFIGPKDTIHYKPYAAYKMGLFFQGNTTDQPYDFRYIGNGRTVSKILDVDDTDIPPRVDLSAPRQIKEPYVCIAAQASAYCKLWTNPHGWLEVIEHLKKIGYRVLCIDKDKVTGQGIATNHIPYGAEDFTGNKPLQERINLLKDCDFFIGLSSGVSWLAWCAKCPVVMISGFTNPFNEFYTPYRVINTLFCHGCWNDERCEFDHFDYMWCPRHKGTEHAYECSKTITSRFVLNTIKKIPAYQERLEKSIREQTVIKVNEYLSTHRRESNNYDVERISDKELNTILLRKNSGNVDHSNEDIANELGTTPDVISLAFDTYNTTKKKLTI